jgi:cytochrome c-type biogenesis protein CcmH
MLSMALWASPASATPDRAAQPAAEPAAAAPAVLPADGDFPPAMMQAIAERDATQAAPAPSGAPAEGEFPPAMMQAMAAQDAGQEAAPAASQAEAQATTSSAPPTRLSEPPAGAPVTDQAEVTRRARSISEGLRCPVCQGLSAADSQAESAIAMRTRAEDLVAAGYSDAQINAYFVKNYGEWVLLEPPRAGRHWFIWLGPLVLLGLGALVVAWRMTAEANPTTATTIADEGDEDPFEKRILDELERS